MRGHPVFGFVLDLAGGAAQQVRNVMSDLLCGPAPRNVQVDRASRLEQSTQKSAAAERLAVILAEGQSLLVEPVGIFLGEDDIV